MSVFELVVICMGVLMSKVIEEFARRPLLWGVALVVVFLTVATVYAIMPGISLNSPTSFPVDI